MDASRDVEGPQVGANARLRTAALDFSEVISLEEAWRLVGEGRLFPVLLFPSVFGGTDTPENRVFVPRRVAAELSRITEEVARLVGKRFAVTVDVTPERRGECLVPSRIRVQAGLVASSNAFEWILDVW
jgi:hypothetical protein